MTCAYAGISKTELSGRLGNKAPAFQTFCRYKAWG